MPLYMTLAGEFGYGRSVERFNYVDIVSFSNWHVANASTFTSNIPNFHFYTYDGSISTINDGGFNMWNIGNYITLNGVTTASTIAYGTLANTPQSGYGYFVSQAGVWPQVDFAYARSGTLRWNNSGNPGTAGTIGSSNANWNGYYTTSNRNRYGTYWVNQKYGKLNPTICYVWFTIMQPNLGSIINTVTDGRSMVTPPYPSYNQFISLTGSNFIFCQMLFSVLDSNRYPSGYLIPDGNINAFITNYVENATINIY